MSQQVHQYRRAPRRYAVGDFPLLPLLAYENFESQTLGGADLFDGWAAAGIVDTYAGAVGFESFETSTLNNNTPPGPDFGWVNPGTGIVYGLTASVTPTSVLTTDGSNVTFTATASQGFTPYTYQWTKNGSNIVGQTASTLTLSSISSGDYATYACVVTDNQGLSVTSNNATLANIVDDWAARVVTNGGAAPSTATKNALKTFWAGLVTDGLDSLMYTVNCIAPDSLIAAMTPLKVGPSTRPLWIQVGSPTFTNSNVTVNGFTGNTTAAWEVGLVPSTMFSATNIGMSLYVYASGSNVGTAGGDDTSSGRVLVIQNNVQWTAWAYTDQIYTAVTAQGFCTGSRVSASDSRLYFANSTTPFAQKGSTVTTQHSSPPATEQYFSGYNNAGTLIAASNSTQSFVAWHQGLNATQSQNLYNRVQALRTNLGGGFV